MRILELFAGTHSIGKAGKELGHEVISLDITDKLAPNTHTISILEWDYKSAYKVGHFDMIWASPPCRFFSNLRCISVPKERISSDIDEYGLPLLMKAIEIIEYFKPKYYGIENPFNGKMKDYMPDPYATNLKVCSYCQYGYDYQKNTAIWTNVPCVLKRCGKHSSCWRKHNRQVGLARASTKDKFVNGLALKYRIPHALCIDILNSCY